MRILGLMSGTSADGLSMAVVEAGRGRPRVLDHGEEPFSPADRRFLLALPSATAPDLCAAGVRVAELFAKGARRLARGCALAGSHGQTVWHIPGRASLQIGDGCTIAARLGLPVVSDFRAADIAAGGQGAPLVPFADRLLFARPRRSVAVLNIGGIANITWIGRRGEVAAFDTGPGNCLLDAAARSLLGRAFDPGGRTARRGRPDLAWLTARLRHPYFAQPPPKSTGRELFDAGWVPRGSAPDVLATLARLTAASLGSALFALGPVDDVYVGGGGWKNRFLIELIEEHAGIPLRPTDDAGVPSDAREAAAFALLAWAHHRRIPANIATGGRPAILGKLSPAGPVFLPRSRRAR